MVVVRIHAVDRSAFWPLHLQGIAVFVGDGNAQCGRGHVLDVVYVLERLNVVPESLLEFVEGDCPEALVVNDQLYAFILLAQGAPECR
jgi:hypothetical protein